MKLKTGIAILLAAAVGTALIVAGPAAAKKKAKGPVVVGTDTTGDWGANSDPQLAPVGDEMGGDLVEASITMADKTTVNFIITVNKLPGSGGTPEAMRYIWSASVDGEYVELDGKFTNYSRGACDPTAGSCPPPRDPRKAPFAVRGNCTTNEASVTTCEEIGLVHAEFNVDAATITIPVPLELLGAKKGSKITAGTSDFTAQAGGPVLTIPSAFFSRSDMPSDAMQITGTFVVPRK
jgi:hypothetical protein